MSDFVGRCGYMAALEAELDGVRGTGRGRFVSIRGGGGSGSRGSWTSS